jgi:hypothetical protein
MTTLEEFEDDLTFLVGDDSTFWQREEKDFAANESLRVWQAMTGEFPATAFLTANGDVYYDVPRQLVSVQRVLFEGNPLAQTSLAELDYGSPGWEGTAGTPTSWAPIGLNLFALSPAPASGNIVVEGLAELETLVGPSATVTFMDDVLSSLEAYGHHYLVFKEGGQEFKAAQDGLQHVTEAGAVRNQEILTTDFYRAYKGLQRDEGQRPSRAGEPSVGVRL